LSGLIVSEISSEFVIHVTGEYDYRFSSSEKRNNILLTICKSYYMNVKNSPLPFFFKEDINLIEFTTTEDDRKKNLVRIPKSDPELMNEDSL
jgi:serum/glucocorticoid-regulated kinase 2